MAIAKRRECMTENINSYTISQEITPQMDEKHGNFCAKQNEWAERMKRKKYILCRNEHTVRKRSKKKLYLHRRNAVASGQSNILQCLSSMCLQLPRRQTHEFACMHLLPSLVYSIQTLAFLVWPVFSSISSEWFRWLSSKCGKKRRKKTEHETIRFDIHMRRTNLFDEKILKIRLTLLVEERGDFTLRMRAKYLERNQNIRSQNTRSQNIRNQNIRNQNIWNQIKIFWKKISRSRTNKV